MTIGRILHRLSAPRTCDCACYRRGYQAARIDAMRRIFPRMPEHRLRRLLQPIRHDS